MSQESPNLSRLLDIMARLRDPETGCPWDIQQTFSTIAPYTIEEAYEVSEATLQVTGIKSVMSLVICCYRWCFMPRWPQKKTALPLMRWRAG